MASNTTIKGEFAALKVDQRAIQTGFVSSKPVYDCAYDRILEKDGKFHRVQIKYVGEETSNPSSGSAVIRLTRVGHDSRKAKTYTSAEVDVVIGYIASIDKLVWLVPSCFDGKTVATVRYETARNGQLKGCLMLSDCEW